MSSLQVSDAQMSRYTHQSPERKQTNKQPHSARAADADFTELTKSQELANQIEEGRARLKYSLERVGSDGDASVKNTVTFVKTMTNSRNEEIDYFIIKSNIGTLDGTSTRQSIEALGCKIESSKKETVRVSIATSKYDKRMLAINMSTMSCMQLALLFVVAVFLFALGLYSLRATIWAL
jgi:maltodextrin utilization protein YvdJ